MRRLRFRHPRAQPRPGRLDQRRRPRLQRQPARVVAAFWSYGYVAPDQNGNGDTLTILSAGSPVSGSFANVASGSRLATNDGRGSFRVSYGAGTNTVVPSDFLLPGQTDTLPMATLSVPVPSVTADSGQDAEFLLTLSSAQISDVTVNFTIKGTAVNGTDYVLLNTSKKIKAGKTSKPIKIVPVSESFYARGKEDR